MIDNHYLQEHVFPDEIGFRESGGRGGRIVVFDFAPCMEQEPRRILHNGGLAGVNALAVLEVVGRGASRTPQIASRPGTAQTNIPRLLQQLMDASVLSRGKSVGRHCLTHRNS